MPWVYSQSTGQLKYNGVLVTKGYSGIDAGKNNPAMEGVRHVGPTPAGDYSIGAPFFHAHSGAYTMRLTPINGNIALGRTGIMMHGDSKAHPGRALNGCMIVSYSARQKVWMSNDHIIKVTE